MININRFDVASDAAHASAAASAAAAVPADAAESAAAAAAVPADAAESAAVAAAAGSTMSGVFHIAKTIPSAEVLALVDRARAVVQRHEGVLYSWWIDGDDTCGDRAPFWAFNGPPPSELAVRDGGLNCAGLINLICRELDLPIPGVAAGHMYAGGTEAWSHFLNANGCAIRLKEVDAMVLAQRVGTLFFSNYHSPQDQGHLAIVLQPGRLSHCYPDSRYTGVRSEFARPGVVLDEPWEISHGWHTSGYYTHACIAEMWLRIPAGCVGLEQRVREPLGSRNPR
jgi:cell wall-associated NlpC family hydrolase